MLDQGLALLQSAHMLLCSTPGQLYLQQKTEQLTQALFVLPAVASTLGAAHVQCAHQKQESGNVTLPDMHQPAGPPLAAAWLEPIAWEPTCC